MVGLLSGGGSALLNSVFASIYPSGVLHVPTQTEDDGGSITETWADIAIKVQTDRVTEAMRQQPGYADADVRVIILSAGVDAITSDMEATDGRGERWELSVIGQDPCGSHWECAGVRAS